MILYIAECNIKKAWNIQEKDRIKALSKECYDELNWEKILEEQNILSSDNERGSVWVLCTCIAFLGEYKFFWSKR